MNQATQHMTSDPSPPEQGGARARPLAPVLLIVAFNSLGTGAVMNGIFFLARSQHGFNEQQNLLLGLVLGATYIVGAVGVGPLIRKLTGARWCSPRAALGWVHLALGLLCFLPFAVNSAWSVWVFAVLYSPLTGALWPIVESYLSGGRRGKGLRHAVGAFNLVWASSVIVSYWAMSLVLREGEAGAATEPMVVIAALGAVHLLTIAAVCRLAPAPARHLEDEHEPHPEVYTDLLRATRWLLVLSYILVCALNPILPTRLESLRVDAEAGVRIASAWAMSRLALFLLMQRWHGWHGRWRTTIWTGASLALGFALTVLAPSVGVLIAGLALFGVGVGGIYCAALYYAMEVGAAEVEAGGKHEALIGLGYTAGPFIGLAPWLAHNGGLLDAARIAPSIVALAIIAGAVTLIGALWPLRTRKRRGAHRSE